MEGSSEDNLMEFVSEFSNIFPDDRRDELFERTLTLESIQRNSDEGYSQFTQNVGQELETTLRLPPTASGGQECGGAEEGGEQQQQQQHDVLMPVRSNYRVRQQKPCAK